jgi:predicted lipoprotein with Yx(FWY)xxD motif
MAASTVTVGSASSSKLEEQIAVSSAGRTLYALSPETTSHLLCKSSECLKFWPPVTVPSRSTKLKAGPGVHGHLGILHRSNGVLQVTLRGLPLYRFSEDHAKGQTHGQGIESFGGTWHAVTASSTPTPTPTMTAPQPAPAPTAPAPAPTAPPSYGY